MHIIQRPFVRGCSLLGAAVCVSSAGAAVSFTSATRTITAVATNGLGNLPADTVTDSISGFGQYDNTLQRQLQSSDQPVGTLQEGYAEQHSFIGVDALSFSGRVSGTDHTVSSGTGNGLGLSVLTLNFTLTSSTPWSAAFVNDFSPAPFNAQDVFGAGLLISSPSNPTVVSFSGIEASSPHSGILDPGTYTLRLSITAGHTGLATGSTGINYNWAVNIPAPATGLAFALLPLAVLRRRS